MVLLTWLIEDSIIQDSGILPVVRIIEENFPTVKFTLELIDEENLKYMNYQSAESVDVSYNLWPRYTSSQVFFSSIMDFLMA